MSSFKVPEAFVPQIVNDCSPELRLPFIPLAIFGHPSKYASQSQARPDPPSPGHEAQIPFLSTAFHVLLWSIMAFLLGFCRRHREIAGCQLS
ncbi:hypothetical protein N658DRAFT_66882 [Parathielavia hyrcaniae]|uniref:Uncharacterized protein n=1 Tax=Parathielavia hyrcaniae TaxID=113614 RepID=A0AAN6T218_9PEZI|nr:hypothetical protein N658DRAFT_66882 [Parathielavia hyrcaniae]